MDFFESDDDIDNDDEANEEASSTGRLKIKSPEPNVRLIYFVPSTPTEVAVTSEGQQNVKTEVLIAKVDATTHRISIYPFKTFDMYDDYLDQKYQKIKEIVIDWYENNLPEDEDDAINIFENFPQGFIKRFQFGFGFQRDYRFIIHSLEKMDNINKLLILSDSKTEIKSNENTFILNFFDYHEIRKEINRISRHGQRASRAIKTFNVDEMLQKNIYENAAAVLNLKGEVDEIEQLIESGLENRSRKYVTHQQKKAVELVTKSSEQIFKQNPQALIKLHQNIELVTLDRLIDRYEQMIEKSVSEAVWQKLFTNNPFILSLAFGFPVMLVQSQAYVGGGRIQGDGEKIADFLVKTKSTNNAAIFEIKTPQTKLVRSRPFREGIHGPSSDLTDAINQIGDQINKLLMNIYSIKVNSKIFDLESYSVQGVLIVGCTPAESDEKKSLDLFRANIKNINILTFDELLEKLRQLHSFLSTAN